MNMNKSILISAVAALALFAAQARAAESHADAATTIIKDARDKLQHAKARGHGHGLFRIAHQHLDLAVWLIAHGRELKNTLKPKEKMHWKNPQWKLPHTVQKYEPKD